MDYKAIFNDLSKDDTSIMRSRVSVETIKMLSLPPDAWLATTIDHNGWQETYITDKYLDDHVQKYVSVMANLDRDDLKDFVTGGYFCVLYNWNKANGKGLRRHHYED